MPHPVHCRRRRRRRRPPCATCPWDPPRHPPWLAAGAEGSGGGRQGGPHLRTGGCGRPAGRSRAGAVARRCVDLWDSQQQAPVAATGCRLPLRAHCASCFSNRVSPSLSNPLWASARGRASNASSKAATAVPATASPPLFNPIPCPQSGWRQSRGRRRSARSCSRRGMARTRKSQRETFWRLSPRAKRSACHCRFGGVPPQLHQTAGRPACGVGVQHAQQQWRQRDHSTAPAPRAPVVVTPALALAPNSAAGGVRLPTPLLMPHLRPCCCPLLFAKLLTLHPTPPQVVCHFFHRDFERCRIMDKHLGLLAKKHFGTRFIKLSAPVGAAPCLPTPPGRGLCYAGCYPFGPAWRALQRGGRRRQRQRRRGVGRG